MAELSLAAVVINEEGALSAEALRSSLPDLTICRAGSFGTGSLSELTELLFRQYRGIIFFCATGIAVRLIGPHVKSKYTDPAVVVVDNGARHAISLLSGHEGGANNLAFTVSRILAARPVITTATEARKPYVMGLGTRRGIGAEQVCDAVRTAAGELNISLDEIRTAATVTAKCGEPGLLYALEKLSLPLVRITDGEINRFSGAFAASAASRHLAVPAVAEPCALLAAREGILVYPKKAFSGVTVAVAKERIVPAPLSSEAIEEQKENE